MLLLIYVMSRGTLSSFNLSNMFRCCFKGLWDAVISPTSSGWPTPGGYPPGGFQARYLRPLCKMVGGWRASQANKKVQNARWVVIGGVKSIFWTETIDGFRWHFAVFVNCSVSWRFMHWRQDFELVCVSCVLPVGVGSCQACREALQKLATKRCRACDRIGSGLRDWWGCGWMWLVGFTKGYRRHPFTPEIVLPWCWA